MDFFRTPANASPDHRSAIKAWVTEVLRIPAEAHLFVTELRCTEPGCPPFETVIALMTPGGAEGARETRKIAKPLAEITRADIEALAAGTTDHDHVHPR